MTWPGKSQLAGVVSKGGGGAQAAHWLPHSLSRALSHTCTPLAPHPPPPLPPSGAIIFIDEIDAIGTKRSGGDGEGSKEVQRTMLELLNQLDGFSTNDKIKVIAATNRPETLDPALLRSGRLDRKIELPHPDETARARILQIHSRKMACDLADINFEELARATDDFNGAMLKAVCVEAGMIALRRDARIIRHQDYVDGIMAVQMKKRAAQKYYV